MTARSRWLASLERDQGLDDVFAPAPRRPAPPLPRCPEHGCELEPDGECLDCTGWLDEDDYPIFHD